MTISPGPVVVRLADHAAGAPYFASSIVLPRSVPRHSLDHAEIVAVTGGQGRLGLYRPGGEVTDYPLRPGSMFLIRPEDQFRYASRDGDLAAVYVSFSLAEWRSFAGLIGLTTSWATSESPPRASFDPANRGTLRAFDRALHRFRKNPTSLDLVRFWLHVVPILFPDDDGPARRREPAPTWLTRSLDAMRAEEHLREGLPRFLKLAHVSSSHLAASTRRYFDASPGEILRDLRLRHAAHLLATTADSIGTIALRCGSETIRRSPRASAGSTT